MCVIQTPRKSGLWHLLPPLRVGPDLPGRLVRGVVVRVPDVVYRDAPTALPDGLEGVLPHRRHAPQRAVPGALLGCGQMGSTLMGSLQKKMTDDPSCKNMNNCSDPISADPDCPFPTSLQLHEYALLLLLLLLLTLLPLLSLSLSSYIDIYIINVYMYIHMYMYMYTYIYIYI